MCSKSKLFVNKLWIFVLTVLALLCLAQSVPAYQARDFNWIPPFLAEDEKPSITIIFDNSGSMLGRAYTGTFNPQKEYYGYFDPRIYYNYTDNAFEPSGSGQWNGNWLNWALMLRVDVARKVMTGGAYNTTGKYYEGVKQDTSNRVSNFSYNDKNKILDLNKNMNFMTPYHADITISHPKSQSDVTIHSEDYNKRVKEPKKEGVLHQFKDKARMALFTYDQYNKDPNKLHHGGKVLEYMGENATHIDSIINEINTLYPTSWTPLAETLHTVYGYIRQDSSGQSNTGPRYRGNTSYTTSTTTDPYYFAEVDDLVWCTKQNVILITDGESTQDQGIPASITKISGTNGKVTKKTDTDYNLASEGSSYLIDVALWGQTEDMRADFSGKQTVDLYTVFAFGAGSPLLIDASRCGKLSEADQATLALPNGKINLKSSYPRPDNYFEAESGEDLEAAVTQAFQAATASKASGTAAAVSSQTQDGDGAVYQAIFFPPSDLDSIAPPWSGQVHAFFIDQNGTLREDTDQNGKLDVNATSGTGDKPIALLGDDETPKYLWSSSTWLNALTDAQAKTQRDYSSTNKGRYIFTFADKAQKMVPQDGDIQPFEFPTSAILNSPDYFYNFLTPYETPATKPTDTQLKELLQRQVEFIRGAELESKQVGTISDQVRSRTWKGTTWRLGDVVYSSPTVVGRPASGYHVLYRDKTYRDFINTYLNRRQMIYAGANDGMLHAFNGGFFNSKESAFEKTGNASETQYDLGMEMWAYVPYNLLPHLKWLMHPEYGTDLHVAYMDLKPRVFDARIFFNEDGVTPSNNSTHPNGWGTVLVAGMRLGGAKIDIEVDGSTRTMSSAYVIMDITNPEEPPRLLGEVKVPNLGFTTNCPTVMPMSTPNAAGTDLNEWFLVFGSGPANANGIAVPTLLGTETSAQKGRLFILDLKKLVTQKEVATIDSNGNPSSSGAHFVLTENESFISDPVAADLDYWSNSDGKFKADVVYYGTTAGGQNNARGKIYRLQTENKLPASKAWKTSTLIDVGQPITVPIEYVWDEQDRVWVYFGTGRFFNRGDTTQDQFMNFYGIKEPINAEKNLTWAEVPKADLFDSSKITVAGNTCSNIFTKTCVIVKNNGQKMTGSYAAGHWENLMEAVNAKKGWKLTLPALRERVFTKSAIFGGAVLFTSYEPDDELCTAEGTSKLWALYYKTGTAYYKPIIGFDTDTIFNTSIDLGRGMASSPTVHVGNRPTIIVSKSTGDPPFNPLDGSGFNFEPPISPAPEPIYWRTNFN